MNKRKKQAVQAVQRPRKRNRVSGLLPVFLFCLFFGITVLLSCILYQNVEKERNLRSEAALKSFCAQESLLLSQRALPTSPAETPLPIMNTPQIVRPLLVNAAHPLPDEYVPAHLILLSDMKSGLFSLKRPDIALDLQTAQALCRMLEAAWKDGITVWQISEGYRSIQDQQAIWDEQYEKYRNQNGLSEKKALEAVSRRVAKPGSSEHHTGEALDISVPGCAFRNTAQYAWLKAHCWEYGFIIRYTEEKEAVTGIRSEPWHIRYVGTLAASVMKEKGLCLEEYFNLYPHGADAPDSAY